VDIVNDTRGKIGLMTRRHVPLSDAIVSLSMSTTIIWIKIIYTCGL
jgi:hypothetical protein